MPIVNHLSYGMNGNNKRIEDVTLVGFAQNADDFKTATKIADENRTTNILSTAAVANGRAPPPYRDRYDDKYDLEKSSRQQNGKPINGYVNAAFHHVELENNCGCCIDRNQNDFIPRKIDYSNGNDANGLNKSSASEYSHGSESTSSWAEDTMRRCCSKKVLYKRIPILNLFESYRKDMIISDLVAGITVGMTMVPQAIAYANVAGLPPKYGLYSAFLACFIYVIFGSCKESSIGPTAIMSIILRESIHGLGPSFAILLCFLTGIVQLIMGILQLGFLIDFISGPVSAGFTSAAAIVIAMTQVKDLLGLNYGANKFMEVWDQLSIHFREISKSDAILGFTCMFVLLALRKVKDIPIGSKDTKEKTSFQKFLLSFLWFLSTARNILVVVISSTIVYMWKEYFQTEPPFKLSASVEKGLPDIAPPAFSTTVDNITYNFVDMTSNLGSGIIIVPLLSLLENISLAKVFSNGKSVDATQELLALGACNVLSSFVGSVPLSGGLSRGAVNNASGAKSTVGSIYAGIIVIVSLQFFTPYFSYIPKASLAAVIIAAVIFMVEFHVVKPMWKSKKIDLIPAAATFLCSLLFRLELGILVGVGINVLFLLYGSARPKMPVEKYKSEWGYEYIVITPDRNLAFPSVQYVRNAISKAGVKQGCSSIPVVIDSKHVHGADFTAAKGIKSLIEDFVKRNQLLVFYNLKPSVVEIFRAVQPSEFHHCQTQHQLRNFLEDYYLGSSCKIAEIKH